ncbi:MAG: hypothetical protein DDG59_06690 [Anaerolineae bacterium]|nr:MAG: hypothetical protein DDG59_06690 [Anaerolineae bacterium]
MVNWSYRLWQFWNALRAKPNFQDRELIDRFLTPSLVQVFERLDPSEQAHAVRVCRKLIDEGESDSTLLTAALLHDIGKICYRLRLWERAWIVIFRWIGKKMGRQFRLDEEGLEKAVWWKRPLLVGKFHPSWGAALLRSQGVDEPIVWLVAYHQDAEKVDPTHPRFRLLKRLVQADQSS